MSEQEAAPSSEQSSDFSASSVDNFLRQHGFDIDAGTDAYLSSLSNGDDDEEVENDARSSNRHTSLESEETKEQMDIESYPSMLQRRADGSMQSSTTSNATPLRFILWDDDAGPSTTTSEQHSINQQHHQPTPKSAHDKNESQSSSSLHQKQDESSEWEIQSGEVIEHVMPKPNNDTGVEDEEAQSEPHGSSASDSRHSTGEGVESNKSAQNEEHDLDRSMVLGNPSETSQVSSEIQAHAIHRLRSSEQPRPSAPPIDADPMLESSSYLEVESYTTSAKEESVSIDSNLSNKYEEESNDMDHVLMTSTPADQSDHLDQVLTQSADTLSPIRSQQSSYPLGRTEEAQEPSVQESSSSEQQTSYRRPVDSRSVEEDPVDAGDWTSLNDLLRQNALPTIQFEEQAPLPSDNTVIVPVQSSLIHLLQDLIAQLSDKNDTIQDMMLDARKYSSAKGRSDGALESSEKRVQRLQQALNKSNTEVDRLKESIRKQSKEKDEAYAKLEKTCAKAQQKVDTAKHQVRAKDKEIESLQEKLTQFRDKEDVRRKKARQSFEKFHNRVPRKASARDSERVEFLAEFESQKSELEDQVTSLQQQVSMLRSELKDKERVISRALSKRSKEEDFWDYKEKGPLSETSDEMILERLEAARREQEKVANRLRRREKEMLTKMSKVEKELMNARETIQELKDENANLTLDIESRPTIRAYRLSQRRIHELERQLADGKHALDQAQDLTELRKYMDTKELMQRDRMNHRLHLNRLDSLPKETLLEVVKDVCRLLHLQDLTLIAPSLEKLCNVVAVVPRMEKFVRDVCGFVFYESNTPGRFRLEDVLPTLQQWTVERTRMHELEKFKVSVVKELCKRPTEPTLLTEREREDGSTLGKAAYMVEELVELEKNVLHHKEIYSLASEELERQPSVLINQIVRHLMHVFQIPKVDGVLPKINQLYLFTNEMETFLSSLRPLLQLHKNASTVACLDAVKQCVNQSSAPTPRRYDDEGDTTPNFVVDKKSRGSKEDTPLAGVRQVRQMSVLVQQLQRELGAATMDDILPRTKRLMELLSLSLHDHGDEDEDD